MQTNKSHSNSNTIYNTCATHACTMLSKAHLSAPCGCIVWPTGPRAGCSTVVVQSSAGTFWYLVWGIPEWNHPCDCLHRWIPSGSEHHLASACQGLSAKLAGEAGTNRRQVITMLFITQMNKPECHSLSFSNFMWGHTEHILMKIILLWKTKADSHSK